MHAQIIKKGENYQAIFERELVCQKHEVWSMLTENDKLNQWFSEISIQDLRKGGAVVFDMGDNSFERLEIVEFKRGKILAFNWWEDEVRFEVSTTPTGTTLTLIEFIRGITSQTAKDLAGWHVCLDVIESLLNGKEIDRHSKWEKEFAEYERIVDSLTIELE